MDALAGILHCKMLQGCELRIELCVRLSNGACARLPIPLQLHRLLDNVEALHVRLWPRMSLASQRAGARILPTPNLKGKTAPRDVEVPALKEANTSGHKPQTLFSLLQTQGRLTWCG